MDERPSLKTTKDGYSGQSPSKGNCLIDKEIYNAAAVTTSKTTRITRKMTSVDAIAVIGKCWEDLTRLLAFVAWQVLIGSAK